MCAAVITTRQTWAGRVFGIRQFSYEGFLTLREGLYNALPHATVIAIEAENDTGTRDEEVRLDDDRAGA
jgi:hypothetical protein